MKTLKLFMALLIGAGLTGIPMPAAHAQQGPPPGYWEPGPPPGNWSNAWHNGFHDGIVAAHHDIDAGRPPDPRRHDDFRHPDRPADQRHDFREGFRRGYQMVYDHDWHRH